jgi:hypothetical protein
VAPLELLARSARTSLVALCHHILERVDVEEQAQTARALVRARAELDFSRAEFVF